jgi:hypothetical protein
MAQKKQFANIESTSLMHALHLRFSANMHRHADKSWEEVEKRIKDQPEKLQSLQMMEDSGGEPDVIGKDIQSNEIIFADCSTESPAGRRSLCYDRKALDARKENKPKNSVLDMAEEMGIELMNEEQYHDLQKLGRFDCKTSSWLQTPASVRELGGAIFGDYRFGMVFIYHNGADSYYAARGFRGLLRI